AKDEQKLMEWVKEIKQTWDWTKPLRIEWKVFSAQRKLSANNLYWLWLDTMAKHFSKKKMSYTKDEMHDLMRHQFLGYEDKIIGKTVISAQLKSTAEMGTPSFCDYMTKIDIWASDHGVLLSRPEDSEYAKYKEAA
ncbi:hypothetical protein KAR91_68120, partial [Candidatus Pacearchaeota archaeon]|nr:hypothetical protein [Candidatus Pacearchaeota archaeon]